MNIYERDNIIRCVLPAARNLYGCLASFGLVPEAQVQILTDMYRNRLEFVLSQDKPDFTDLSL